MKSEEWQNKKDLKPDSLIGLCGMHIEVEQTFDLDKISFWIEGDATSEDIEQIANLLVPNLEDLTASQPDWEEGYDGLIQLITLAHISDLLHQSRDSS